MASSSSLNIWNSITSIILVWILLITLTTNYGVNCDDQSEQNQLDTGDNLMANEKRSSWQNLQGSWGKRNLQLEELLQDPRYNNYGTGVVDDLMASGENYYIPNGLLNDDERQIAEVKRAWNSMNGAWGKRVNKDWNKFRGNHKDFLVIICSNPIKFLLIVSSRCMGKT